MVSLLGDPFSSAIRPTLRGPRGAVAAAHPLACAAAQLMFAQDGNAADALIAAQAVLTVIAPDACGLGGDLLALVDQPDGEQVAVTGAGAAPAAMTSVSGDGANSITVPGLVSAWVEIATRWGALPLAHCLAPAIRLAAHGIPVTDALHATVKAQKSRLLAGGAQAWTLFDAKPGDVWTQPALARLLSEIAADGSGAFYAGNAADAIERAIQALGGSMTRTDLTAHRTHLSAPISVQIGPWRVAVQPPPTQGVLLAMSLQARASIGDIDPALADHVGVELTEAAFAFRAQAAAGSALLDETLEIDLTRAKRRGGPRAYLHTAGVATSDASGLTISSLVSVFDDFGSCVFVPELGITLNNRAGGFTTPPNDAAPSKYPVHTLAPIMMTSARGKLALATPGADGQVQTLLQILDRVIYRGETLDSAMAAPRWRGQNGSLLIEDGHPGTEHLAALGHDVKILQAGDLRFGGAVCAGKIDGENIALADWRRECWAGVA